MSICVVGIGNEWASDDGVGPEVVRRLQAEGDANLSGITFHILPQPDFSLLETLRGYDVLVVVDAVHGGRALGTIYREEWRPGLLEARGVERASSHGMGLSETLMMAAVLGQLPPRVCLWGIEVVQTTPGRTLSPEVAAAVPSLIARLRQELASYHSAMPAA